MFLSVFDIFKIGIGPSSSHTMGPMLAAGRFLNDLRGAMDRLPESEKPFRLSASLHGSLAFTGKGHATDRALILGLCGFSPDTLDPDQAETIEMEVYRRATIRPNGLPELRFQPTKDLVFDYGPPLSGHPNGLVIEAWDRNGRSCCREVYYSVGGGFVVTEQELLDDSGSSSDRPLPTSYPYPFQTAAEMLDLCQETGLTIAELQYANEVACRDPMLEEGLDRIWNAMNACIDRGLTQDGILPGGLKVRRRAKSIYEQLLQEGTCNQRQPHQANDWLSVYAMAVNEENAAGGRVVTSPTNGAAGVVPAVGRYLVNHCLSVEPDAVRKYLLVAAAIGGIIKRNASISGAEVGCQGEVGSASAMAAGGLCAALGGTNEQVENAAEIALEHHLGMTCDPAAGLVQVPCIERNALGAVKAVSAASLALRGDGRHLMPLDNCIEVMRQTGMEMDAKYKETSLGGIAVNLPEC